MTKLDEKELEFTRHLPGAERGNPAYFDNEVVDHLLSIVLELGAQFWVVRDRLAFIEEQLASNGSLSLQELELGRPSEALQEKLKEERQAMIRQVYGRLYSRFGGDKVDAAAAPMS